MFGYKFILFLRDMLLMKFGEGEYDGCMHFLSPPQQTLVSQIWPPSAGIKMNLAYDCVEDAHTYNTHRSELNKARERKAI